MGTKITVNLPDEAVAAAKMAVADGRVPSVSAYVAEALDRTYGTGPLAQVIADIIAEHGEPTADERRWAEEAIGLR